MKRKQLKVVWEHELLPTPFIKDAGKPIPTTEPNIVGTDGRRYWFNEMCSATAGATSTYSKIAGGYVGPEALIMDICPRTGMLMTLNPKTLSWHMQPKAIQLAYQEWVAERFLLDDTR